MNESSAGEKIRYPNRWPKGVSGNYKGRPKVDPQLRRLARENVEDAVIALTELSKDPKVNSKVRFLASTALIEAAERTNLCFKFMKRSGKTVWQYIYLPPESEKPAGPPSEHMQKILAMRAQYMPRLIDTLTKQQKAFDEAEFEALLS